MRFKIDENLPEDVASVFGDAGHDAVTVLRQKLGGSDDPSIARICQNENRVLVTADTGFAEIRTYPPDVSGDHRSSSTASGQGLRGGGRDPSTAVIPR